MDDERAMLEEVFGESSSDGEEMNGRWEQIDGINGLWLCSHFLSPHHQSSLLSQILNEEGCFTQTSHNHNQAMRFGDLPTWALALSDSIRDCVLESMELDTCLFPPELAWRDPLFDQLIVNIYQPGEGICAHVDLMRFEDGIAIVSLESSCVMHFSYAGEINDDGTKDAPSRKVPVYLAPGSLVLMSGEARYLWKHEINRRPGFQMWEGSEIEQKRRTSITLRNLCKTF